RNAEMRAVRDELEAMGHKVTSRWIDLHAGSTSYLSADALGILEKSFTPEQLSATPDLCSAYAIADWADLDSAVCVISFTCGTGGKGGRHVEFGVGAALGKRLIVVGPREHVFHTLPEVEWFEDWPACRKAL
ncbi:MAG TPA: hypothetical protein VNA32_07345, partial [Actinomycetota bacterium]|nr:hypothetical protein [Actinomycetota bacterium]